MSLLRCALTVCLLFPAVALPCSPVLCPDFGPVFPRSEDAGVLPANASLLVHTSLNVQAGERFIHVFTLDGGSMPDGGFPFQAFAWGGALCSNGLRISPLEPLTPGESYRVHQDQVSLFSDAGIVADNFHPQPVIDVVFTAGAEDHVAPPAPLEPTFSFDGFDAVCTSCGNTQPQVVVRFPPSPDGEPVWYLPTDSRLGTNGGIGGFEIPIACAPFTSGVAEGHHELRVVAIDLAGNQSDEATFAFEAKCIGTDPCGRGPPNPAMVDRPGSCGCTEMPFAGSSVLLLAGIVALRRRRR